MKFQNHDIISFILQKKGYFYQHFRISNFILHHRFKKKVVLINCNSIFKFMNVYIFRLKIYGLTKATLKILFYFINDKVNNIIQYGKSLEELLRIKTADFRRLNRKLIDYFPPICRHRPNWKSAT